MTKMMTFYEFREQWNTMPSKENGFLSLGISHPLNLQIGYYSAQYKSLIVMDTGIIKEIPSSFAVRAVNSQLKNGSWILEFQLIHLTYEEEFLRLCWDMIETTMYSSEALKDLITKYLSWQKFLQYISKTVLSFQSQKGLLGELLFFKECAEEIGVEKAIAAWEGPEGSDQDFLFEDTWAEIKTVALSSSCVNISSFEQLEQEMDGSLIIYVLEKSTEGTGRVTLPEVVANIIIQLGEKTKLRDQFEMKLFKYGYRKDDIDEYKQNWFRVVEKRVYCVDSVFPKLTMSNVAPEIESGSYTLSLSGIEKYRRM